MSQYKVKTVHHPLNCTVEVPGSKSITNRALLMAALSDGECTLHSVLFSDDSRHFLTSLIALGYVIEVNEVDKYVLIHGKGRQIPKKEAAIDVGSAGTAARFLTAMLALSDGAYTIQASEQMKKRPMRPLFEALTSMGAEFTFLEKPGHLPVQVKGAAFGGKKPADKVQVDISESTQFLSALLMVAPMLENGLKIHITSRKTDGSYIRITTKMMHQFGCNVVHEGSLYAIAPAERYIPGTYQIEPDVSAACYFYAAAALTGGHVIVKNVHSTSMQGDMKFLKLLEQMGCTLTEEDDGIRLNGPSDGLKGLKVDMNDFSDQALTLAAIAPYASSDVTITHIGHIRGQECDRLHAIVMNLKNAGITCEEGDDWVCIHPGKPQPCRIETFDDHRVAMAFTVMGLGCDGIEILNPGCCKKTFENYFVVLDSLLKH